MAAFDPLQTLDAPCSTIAYDQGVRIVEGMLRGLLPLIFFTCTAAAQTLKAPDCSGRDHWAAGMAFTKLKNANVITNDGVDFDHVTSKMIVSQRVGKDLWRQVFRVTFPLKSGSPVQAIVVSDASSEECSMSDAQVLLVSKAL